jgi:integral membrane sensor domain MASE1
LKRVDGYLVSFWLWAAGHPRWRATLVTAAASLLIIVALNLAAELTPGRSLSPAQARPPAAAVEQSPSPGDR